MDICLVVGDENVEAEIREQCEPKVRIRTVAPHEAIDRVLPSEREGEVIECLFTADGLLFEWDILQSHLINDLHSRVSRIGVPVVALCRDDPHEQATALLAGADAVVVPPVTPAVLKAMVVAHRRLVETAHDVAVLQYTVIGPEDDAQVRRSAEASRASGADQPAVGHATKPHCITLSGNDVPLSTQQYELLSFLRENANKVMARDEILEAVWGVDFNPGTNVVDVSIHYLRKVLRDYDLGHVIETVRGRGYRFQPPRKQDGSGNGRH